MTSIFPAKSVRAISGYSRATLDLQGTDVVHPTLNNVLAGGGELHALALEVLLVVHGDLENTYGQRERSKNMKQELDKTHNFEVFL